MKRILVTKVLPDGYGVGVIPEMEKPDEFPPVVSRDAYVIASYFEAKKDWKQHLASLPTFLVHPSFNPKEGGWIEQWREEHEVRRGEGYLWYAATSKEHFLMHRPEHRRIVLLPLVEKKEESFFKQIENDLNSIVLAYPVHGKHPYYDMIGKVFEKVKKYNNEQPT